MIIKTIGHGTKSIEEFIGELKTAGINFLYDVRSVPRSLHNPQFNKENLKVALEKEAIGYSHLAEAGGFRHPKKDSVNEGWQNDSFRGFADYMATESFARAIKCIIEKAKEKNVAIMCAETLPWRCHRFLISDALTVQAISVFHIFPMGKEKKHELTPWCKLVDGVIIYPKREEAKRS
ncbi:DUF488 domain-containing protein [Methylacidiphilum caldifontis]|uniref:DUF488 domain-containing protein n=1 Tax=Methylacidiphilum caldifontis TaxID=2795386 RepID=UPI001A8E7734|nr:DUF488 domain-containing protein [Methylacidiphilum caldifontis]QSR89379.1 DUF488 domain-containing protein [Methylacidiphilum caldifontis]